MLAFALVKCVCNVCVLVLAYACISWSFLTSHILLSTHVNCILRTFSLDNSDKLDLIEGSFTISWGMYIYKFFFVFFFLSCMQITSFCTTYCTQLRLLPDGRLFSHNSPVSEKVEKYVWKGSHVFCCRLQDRSEATQQTLPRARGRCTDGINSQSHVYQIICWPFLSMQTVLLMFIALLYYRPYCV